MYKRMWWKNEQKDVLATINKIGGETGGIEEQLWSLARLKKERC